MTEKSPRDRHVVGADTWFDLAQKIREEIEATPSTQRRVVYDRFSQEIGLAADTLRWAVGAARFIDFVAKTDEDLSGRLSRAPMDGVRILARWSGRDHATAIMTAKRYVAGDLTVRGLSALERDGRRLRPERIDRSETRDRFATQERELIVASVTKFIHATLGQDCYLAWGSGSWVTEARLRRRDPKFAAFYRLRPHTLTQLIYFDQNNLTAAVSLHIRKPRGMMEFEQRIVGCLALLAFGYRTVLVADDAKDCVAIADALRLLPPSTRSLIAVGLIEQDYSRVEPFEIHN